MHRSCLTVLLLTAMLTGTAVAGEPEATLPSDEAVAAVALPEAQLRAMLADAVFQTPNMAIGAFSLGVEPSCILYRASADRVIAKHLPLWRDNLVRAFREKIPADALAQAAKEGPRGRPGLAPYMNDIGTVMEKSSGPILDASIAEVLADVGRAAAKIDPTKIDQQMRVRELKDAIAKTGKLCGIIPAADNIAKSESIK